jgi:plastocyanin
MVDNAFSPRSKTITAGTTLVWSNAGALPHTVTGSGFNSGIMMPGTTYRRTFNSPGTYSYLCTLHSGMTGTVIVTGTAVPSTGAEEDGGLSAEEAAAVGGLAQLLIEEVESGPADEAAAAAGATISELTIVDNAYEPVAVTVPVGSTLTWVNDGVLPHTVTDVEGAFDSGFLVTGDTFSLAFDSLGEFEYFCTIHPEMIGTISVVEAALVASVEPDEAAATAAVTDGDGAADQIQDSEPSSDQVLVAGATGSDRAGSPSLGVAIVMAAGLLAAAVAFAGGMAAFGRYAAQGSGENR